MPTNLIFYSSGEDTGVPSGATLNSYVRDQASQTKMVVAIITPMFQSRPFCVAELGAAWARVGTLLPLATPGFNRNDLDGVLDGLLVRHLDDPAALDELHDRVCDATQTRPKASTWGRYKNQWISSVSEYASRLKNPNVVDRADHERLLVELASVKQRLDETTQLLDTVNSHLLHRPTSPITPVNESVTTWPLTAVLTHARAAIRKVPPVGQELLWSELFGHGSVPVVEAVERFGIDEVRALIASGFAELSNGQLLLTGHPIIIAARQASVTLQASLTDLSEDRSFKAWFQTKYQTNPTLSNQDTWHAVLSDDA
ncbi:hypothetical protein ACVBEQ_15375 [Nakamurella sp. GG22]